jgi:hypothetical protein
MAAESPLGSDFLRSWPKRITALSQQLGRKRSLIDFGWR